MWWTHQNQEQIMNEIIDEWEGNVVSSMLGLLSREHQRLQQEEFVCLIAARVKQQRELREAEEMWRRHTETQFRELEDQIVSDVQMVEEEAMERYRNYVLADTITTLADEEVRIELKLMTDIACLAHLKPVADCLNDSLVLAANDVAVDNLGNIKEFSENVTNIHKEVTDKCMNFILSEDFISSLADYKVRREMIPLEQRRRYPDDDGEIDFLIQKEQDLDVSEMKTAAKGNSSPLDEDQTTDTEVAISESLMLEEEICSFDLNGEESDWITEEK
ncbi:uncharacterized protein [Centruroides vittatus]|uniref:uncharacterized protein n=1 Tax=Centruroides vittatus TaxID=120091 RepID=UPI00351092F0